MKNLLLIFAITSLLISCNANKNEQISKPLPENQDNKIVEKENLGQVNIYEGLLSCADCSGIKTVLKIYEGNGTMENYKFELTSVYTGKQPEKTFTQKGNFNYERGLEKDPDGTVYIFNWDKPESQRMYYGYKSNNRNKIFVLNDKREIINEETSFLTLKK